MLKITFIVILLFVVILVIDGLLYWNDMQTPKHSLSQIKKAFEEYDVAAFKKYVNIKSVLDDYINQALEYLKKTEKTDSKKFLGTMFAEGLVGFMKPKIIELIEEKVIDYIETGNFQEYKEPESEDETRISPVELVNNLIGEDISFEDIKYIDEEDRLAYVGLKFYDKKNDNSGILKFTMLNKENYWQVIKLNNVFEFIEQLGFPRDKKDAQISSMIDKELKNTIVTEIPKVKVKLLSKGFVESESIEEDYKNYIKLSVELENNTDKDIKLLKGTIIFFDRFNKKIKSIDLNYNSIIPTNSKKIWHGQIDYNQLDNSDVKLRNTKLENLKYEWEIKEMIYEQVNDKKLL